MAFPPYSYLRFRWVVLGVIVIMLFPLGWDAWFGKSLIAFAFVLLTQFYCPIGWQKLWGLVIGFIAIQALNVVRVISLFYLGQWDKGLFDFAHYYAWQALIILDALVVFLIWLSKLPNENPPSDQPPNNRQPADNASTAAIQQS
ncbi:hypothetical protein GCU85_03350 [Cardiobacteriales bacterium ML27]|uniref:Uncharacterized protein n=2 Tax=Ostreibacterium oceani TaxID=2654998 RepID=A0A6N7F1N9_9GAMM|nr:hypothetical protein [Ostreibacterium oceani]